MKEVANVYFNITVDMELIDRQGMSLFTLQLLYLVLTSTTLTGVLKLSLFFFK